jgi:PmbA protein
MIDKQTALERCEDLIAIARSKGVDAADAMASAQSSESVSVRLGELEDVERSEGESIGLRVFVGNRSASIQTSDFSPESFETLAERAVDMARLAPEDEYAGLAPEDKLYSGSDIDLDLIDAAEPSPQLLRERAKEAEDAARAVEGITNSNGGGASFGSAVMALVTSHGFARAYGATTHGLSASVVAGEGGSMETDYEYRTARHIADLPEPEWIGTEAGKRTAARLNAGTLASKPMPVVFDPRIGSGLIGHLLGAMSGTSAARKSTFLLGKEKDQLFDSAVRITEDPLRLRGQNSRPFDGEGLACIERNLIEEGRMFGWMTNAAAARQLGAEMTGHAARGSGGAPGVGASNIHLERGAQSPVQLMADIEEGLYVTEVSGQGVNLVTGDYSRGAFGFRIERGEITTAVSEITIAGNLADMFLALTPANDLEMVRSVNVPTLRIDGMTVAGE